MKASRLFASEEMKKAASDFVDNVTINTIMHYGASQMPTEEESDLIYDSFLAGAIWYKETHK